MCWEYLFIGNGLCPLIANIQTSSNLERRRRIRRRRNWFLSGSFWKKIKKTKKKKNIQKNHCVINMENCFFHTITYSSYLLLPSSYSSVSFFFTRLSLIKLQSKEITSDSPPKLDYRRTLFECAEATTYRYIRKGIMSVFLLWNQIIFPEINWNIRMYIIFSENICWLPISIFAKVRKKLKPSKLKLS